MDDRLPPNGMVVIPKRGPDPVHPSEYPTKMATMSEYQVPLSRCTPVVAEWLKSLGAQGVLIKTINGEVVEAEPLELALPGKFMSAPTSPQWHPNTPSEDWASSVNARLDALETSVKQLQDAPKEPPIVDPTEGSADGNSIPT